MAKVYSLKKANLASINTDEKEKMIFLVPEESLESNWVDEQFCQNLPTTFFSTAPDFLCLNQRKGFEKSRGACKIKHVRRPPGEIWVAATSLKAAVDV